MRTKLCTMAVAAIVLVGGSFAIKPAQAMPIGELGVVSAARRLDGVEKFGCWGRMVCSGPGFWGHRPYWGPRAYGFYGPRPWGPRWGYYRGW